MEEFKNDPLSFLPLDTLIRIRRDLEAFNATKTAIAHVDSHIVAQAAIKEAADRLWQEDRLSLLAPPTHRLPWTRKQAFSVFREHASAVHFAHGRRPTNAAAELAPVPKRWNFAKAWSIAQVRWTEEVDNWQEEQELNSLPAE